MTSGADLFVVCRQCGSEVSPYITECPYCGHRLRRRAPKLPRPDEASTPRRGRSSFSTLLRRSRAPVGAAGAASKRTLAFSETRPIVTIAIVAISSAALIAWHAEPQVYTKMVIAGPLRGDWWRLFTYAFTYINGIYAFVALASIGVFGWLLESRHGPLFVLALFLAATVSGGLLEVALHTFPFAVGANAAALAMIAAWAAPDLVAARTGAYYEGDLLATGATAALLLALPFALLSEEASWIAGLTGGVLGLLVGLALSRGVE
jgi:hypothetical protein